MQNQHFKSHDELDQILHSLNLSTFRSRFQKVAEQCDKEGKSHAAYLYDLCIYESERRDQVRRERLVKRAKLPRNKILRDFDIHRIPGLSTAQVERLATGNFMDIPENIFLFGNPGTGKTHLAIALAREWCLMGRRVLYKGASQLVEELRQAQDSRCLHKLLKQLDKIECLIIDDISYVPLQRQEADVLFQLINERYEKRSLLITSNLTFSQWKTIFPDEMTTAAFIDRLIHHSEILELNAPSYRTENAINKAKKNIKPSLPAEGGLCDNPKT